MLEAFRAKGSGLERWMRFGKAEGRWQGNGFPRAKIQRNWLASCDLVKRPADTRGTHGGNQVRQVTWTQTWDGLGFRWRNSHLKSWEIGVHGNFLSRGSERIYFSYNPQGRQKGLVGEKFVRHKRDLSEKKINRTWYLTRYGEWEKKIPVLAWIKEGGQCPSRDQILAFFFLGSRQSQLWLHSWII